MGNIFTKYLPGFKKPPSANMTNQGASQSTLSLEEPSNLGGMTALEQRPITKRKQPSRRAKQKVQQTPTRKQDSPNHDERKSLKRRTRSRSKALSDGFIQRKQFPKVHVKKNFPAAETISIHSSMSLAERQSNFGEGPSSFSKGPSTLNNAGPSGDHRGGNIENKK